jgi:hypothetical protein
VNSTLERANQEAFTREPLFRRLFGLLALAFPDASRAVHVERVDVRQSDLDGHKVGPGGNRQRRRSNDDGEPTGLRIEPLGQFDVERLPQRLGRLGWREDDGRGRDSEHDLLTGLRSNWVRARKALAEKRSPAAGEDELDVGRRNDSMCEHQDAIVERGWARYLRCCEQRLRLLFGLGRFRLLWDGRRLEARAGAGRKRELRESRGWRRSVTGRAITSRQGRTSKGQRVLKLPGSVMLAVRWVVPSARTSVSRGEQCFAANSASFDVPASRRAHEGQSAESRKSAMRPVGPEAHATSVCTEREQLTSSVPTVGDLDLAVDADLTGADVAQPVSRNH